MWSEHRLSRTLDQGGDLGLRLHLLWLAAVCAVMFFTALSTTPFFDKGEPREGLVVQAIVTRGEWALPLRNETDIPSKPPLFHWLGALASLAVGTVTEGTVRFPSALSATLGVLAIYLLGRKLYDVQTALLGGMILATSLAFQGQAVMARVDMTLTFFITLTLALFYLQFKNHLSGPFWSYGFYIAAGIGVLAKGPVSLVIAGMVICLYLAWTKRWDYLSRLCFHKGVWLMVAIALSWYGMALVRGGEDFFGRQVMHENIARFFVQGEGGSGHQKPVYYYLPHLFLLGLPWTLFLPLMAVDGVRKRSAADDGTVFLILWVLIVFVLFSISAGKRAIYLLPLYPALALLTARWFGTMTQPDKVHRFGLRVLAGVCFMVSLLIGAVLLSSVGSVGYSVLGLIAGALKPKDRAGVLLIQSVFDQGGWLFLCVTAAIVFLWFGLSRQLFLLRTSAVPLNMFAVCVLTWLLAHWTFVPALAEARSYRSFVREVSRRAPPGSKVYLAPGKFETIPIFFYYGRAIPVLGTASEGQGRTDGAGAGWVIMEEREWEKMRALDRRIGEPIVRSAGGGPEGDAPLVLVRAREG